MNTCADGGPVDGPPSAIMGVKRRRCPASWTTIDTWAVTVAAFLLSLFLKMNHRLLSILTLSFLPVLVQGRELALRTVGIDAGGREMKVKVLEPKGAKQPKGAKAPKSADGPVPGIL